MLVSIKRPELFFGLVAPIGVNLETTAIELSESLRRHGYTVHILKVTDVFKAVPNLGIKLQSKPLLRRYQSYIRFGNALRKKYDNDAILAALVIAWISKHRKRNRDRSAVAEEKVAYVVHQFKRKEEIDLLRSVYGRLFFQISVYSSSRRRAEYLAHRFADDAGRTDFTALLSESEKLIRLDESEITVKHGQRVREVFHLADFIINRDADTDERKQVDRFVDLIFGKNDISPTRIEYGMYMAKAASLRSLDLSRQVGAATFTQNGEIISMGCNEVPKGGGGTYWTEDQFDDRDYKRGEDPNDRIKLNNVTDFLERLDKKFLKQPSSIEKIVATAAVRESKIMDSLEFGRIIHAEMSAISDAARLGRSTEKANLFCTTFPCHICAKHIIAAGIANVYFLEPYPKSHAFDLHSDSLRVEGDFTAEHERYPKTDFIHFSGVAPRRYRDFFERSKRKKNGKFREWSAMPPRPIFDLKLPIWCTLEDFVSNKISRVLKRTVSRLKTMPFSTPVIKPDWETSAAD